jgi:hypothetical protein
LCPENRRAGREEGKKEEIADYAILFVQFVWFVTRSARASALTVPSQHEAIGAGPYIPSDISYPFYKIS